MKRGLIGCSNIIKAINLQFDLAGHELYTSIHASLHGYALVFEEKRKAPVALCECRQGRDPCTCKDTVTLVAETRSEEVSYA